MLVLIISLVLGFVVYNKAVPVLQTIQVGNQTLTNNILNEGTNFFTGTADNLVLILFVGLTCAALASAILSRAHPMFMYISLIISMFLIFFAVVLSNWYDAFRQNAEVSPVMIYFDKTTYLMNHLPLITLVVIITIGIVLYSMGRAKSAPYF